MLSFEQSFDMRVYSFHSFKIYLVMPSIFLFAFCLPYFRVDLSIF